MPYVNVPNDLSKIKTKIAFNLTKRQAADIHQFIISPIEAHSKKPDETRDKIVALMGDLPRVELFARQTSPGWDVWGNEVEPTIPDFGTNCPEVQKEV